MPHGLATVLGQDKAQRLPPLEAGENVGRALGLSAIKNMRDLGGHKTSDGRMVKRGLVYRSEAFNPVQQADHARLERLGLKCVCDLRTAEEIKGRPDQLPSGIKQLHHDVMAANKLPVPSNLGALLRDPKRANAELGDGKLEAMFASAYRQFIHLPSSQKAYGDLFRSLSNQGNLPAAFHCSSGKDRAGWASAAFLTLLGVPRETVVTDYLRTNGNVMPPYQKLIDDFVAGGGDRGIAVAALGVRREYLEAAFDEVQKRYGSIENYFDKGLGIDAAGQKALKEIFLVSASE